MSYVRCSIIGSAPGGEVWSVNPVFDPTGEFPGGVNQTSLDAAALSIAQTSPTGSLVTLLSTALAVQQCRLEVRDDGTDALIALSHQANTGGVAGSGTPKLPAQAATVLSLRTVVPGGSGRGRIYWPAVGATLNGTLRLSSPSNSTVVADFKTYLNLIKGILVTNFPTIGFDLAVRSKTTHSTPHVNRIQIGDIIDTQRRRRDTMIESYSSLAMP